MQATRPGELRQLAAVHIRRMLLRIGKALTPSDPYTRAGYPLPDYLPLPDERETQEDGALERLSQKFRRDLFVHLLRELPEDRELLVQSLDAEDYPALRSTVHRIIGAVSYCDATELEQELRRLRMALQADNPVMIATYHARVINVIDATLDNAGVRNG